MQDGLPGATQGPLHRIGLLPGDGGETCRSLEQMVVIQRDHQARQGGYIL